jgi:hypothetical protein
MSDADLRARKSVQMNCIARKAKAAQSSLCSEIFRAKQKGWKRCVYQEIYVNCPHTSPSVVAQRHDPICFAPERSQGPVIPRPTCSGNYRGRRARVGLLSVRRNEVRRQRENRLGRGVSPTDCVCGIVRISGIFPSAGRPGKQAYSVHSRRSAGVPAPAMKRAAGFEPCRPRTPYSGANQSPVTERPWASK